jgi:hypothetical protein
MNLKFRFVAWMTYCIRFNEYLSKDKTLCSPCAEKNVKECQRMSKIAKENIKKKSIKKRDSRNIHVIQNPH